MAKKKKEQFSDIDQAELKTLLSLLSRDKIGRSLAEIFSNNPGPTAFVSHEVACRLCMALANEKGEFGEPQFMKAAGWAQKVTIDFILLQFVQMGLLRMKMAKDGPMFIKNTDPVPPIPPYKGQHG